MAITINGSGGVTGLTALPDSAMSSGSIIQVANAAKTDVSTISTYSSSWTDIPSLTLDITPSNANNKILILFDTMITSSATSSPIGFRLLRDSTIIGTHGTNTGDVNAADSFASQYATMGGNTYWFNINRTHYDSPNTTSEITYKLQWRGMNNATTGTFYMNSWVDGSYKCNSNLRAVEIAA